MMNRIDILPKINIIYEDKDFLVIEKPAGLLVHQTKYQKSKTLVDWLLKYYPEIKKVGAENRPGIVHRLDKDVSGLMVVARNLESLKHFIDQFKKSKVKKEYLALVYGSPLETSGLINLPIARTRKGKIVTVTHHKKIKLEKAALTKYEIKKKFERFTLLKLEPLTGRTHQIRVHIKSIGCPIIGDEKYGFKNKKHKLHIELDRIFLHASYLGFYNLKREWKEFNSELPQELKYFLKRIKY